jgi:hypothetical protein
VPGSCGVSCPSQSRTEGLVAFLLQYLVPWRLTAVSIVGIFPEAPERFAPQNGGSDEVTVAHRSRGQLANAVCYITGQRDREKDYSAFSNDLRSTAIVKLGANREGIPQVGTTVVEG